jgi:hypothetical protein
MAAVRDPTALARHAVQAGDWRLVELVARMLGGQSNPPPLAARRAHVTLVVKLGLTGEPGNYDRHS